MISILVPSRKRPQELLRFIQSVLETANDLSQIEVIIRIDSDDELNRAVVFPSSPLTIRVIEGPKKSMGGLNSDCWRESKGEIIILLNDDIVIRTKGWDTTIRQAARLYSDQIYLIHARDGFINERGICFPVLSRTFCELVGDPFPEFYQGDHIDSHLEDLFDRLADLGHFRFLYLDNVYFEHLFHVNGKATVDETYRVRDHLHDFHPLFASWPMRQQLAQRLNQWIETKNAPPLQKAPYLSSRFWPALSPLLSLLKRDTVQSMAYRQSFASHYLYRYFKQYCKRMLQNIGVMSR